MSVLIPLHLFPNHFSDGADGSDSDIFACPPTTPTMSKRKATPVDCKKAWKEWDDMLSRKAASAQSVAKKKALTAAWSGTVFARLTTGGRARPPSECPRCAPAARLAKRWEQCVRAWSAPTCVERARAQADLRWDGTRVRVIARPHPCATRLPAGRERDLKIAFVDSSADNLFDGQDAFEQAVSTAGYVSLATWQRESMLQWCEQNLAKVAPTVAPATPRAPAHTKQTNVGLGAANSKSGQSGKDRESCTGRCLPLPAPLPASPAPACPCLPLDGRWTATCAGRPSIAQTAVPQDGRPARASGRPATSDACVQMNACACLQRRAVSFLQRRRYLIRPRPARSRPSHRVSWFFRQTTPSSQCTPTSGHSRKRTSRQPCQRPKTR